ncbi:MAG: glycosyltransferase family 2 protein [Candidatus Promineifilaceae bacterium]
MGAAARAPAASVVIATWNGRDWLARCLAALDRQSYADFEVVVVDNGSDDGTAEWLVVERPGVHLLRLASNQGFAAANNVGFERALGRFLVTLNNDALPEPGWLERLVAAASRPDVGMVASRVVLLERPGRLDSAGIGVNQAGVAFQRGRGRPAAWANEPGYVFGPSAAAALYKRELLAAVGGFDETFFALYEDVDLAWRAQRVGWRCWYAPAAVAAHHHSATTGRDPARKRYLLGRNKWWTLARNYPWPSLMWWAPLILLVDLAAVIAQTLRHRDLAAVRGRLAALPRLAEIARQRRPQRERQPE